MRNGFSKATNVHSKSAHHYTKTEKIHLCCARWLRHSFRRCWRHNCCRRFQCQLKYNKNNLWIMATVTATFNYF